MDKQPEDAVKRSEEFMGNHKTKTSETKKQWGALLEEGDKVLTANQYETYQKVLAHYDKYNLEFNRYKQDCRKKSLEMAKELIGNELAEWEKSYQDGGATKNDKPTIISTANKYYNWLISIEN